MDDKEETEEEEKERKMGGIEWMERDFQVNDTNRSNIAGTFNRSRNGLFGFILEYPPTLHP